MKMAKHETFRCLYSHSYSCHEQNSGFPESHSIHKKINTKLQHFPEHFFFFGWSFHFLLSFAFSFSSISLAPITSQKEILARLTRYRQCHGIPFVHTFDLDMSRRPILHILMRKVIYLTSVLFIFIPLVSLGLNFNALTLYQLW